VQSADAAAFSRQHRIRLYAQRGMPGAYQYGRTNRAAGRNHVRALFRTAFLYTEKRCGILCRPDQFQISEIGVRFFRQDVPFFYARKRIQQENFAAVGRVLFRLGRLRRSVEERAFGHDTCGHAARVSHDGSAGQKDDADLCRDPEIHQRKFQERSDPGRPCRYVRVFQNVSFGIVQSIYGNEAARLRQPVQDQRIL